MYSTLTLEEVWDVFGDALQVNTKEMRFYQSPEGAMQSVLVKLKAACAGKLDIPNMEQMELGSRSAATYYEPAKELFYPTPFESFCNNVKLAIDQAIAAGITTQAELFADCVPAAHRVGYQFALPSRSVGPSGSEQKGRLK